MKPTAENLAKMSLYHQPTATEIKKYIDHSLATEPLESICYGFEPRQNMNFTAPPKGDLPKFDLSKLTDKP